jgi:predicted metal-dependent peptidase
MTSKKATPGKSLPSNPEEDIRKAQGIMEVARTIFENKLVPYYSDYLHMLSVYWVPNLFATAGSPIGISERMVLIVDPGWVVYIDDPEMLAAILWHEVEHPNRGMSRIKALPNHERANIGGDLAINWQILQVARLPEWVETPKKHGFPNGLTIEQYYELLEKEEQKSKAGKSEEQDGGQSEGEEAEGKSGVDSQWQPTGPSFGSGKCGSAAGNSLGPIEEEANKAMGCSDAEKDLAEEKTREAVKRWVKEKGQGSVPAELLEEIELAERPSVVSWRSKLRSILCHATGKLKAGRTYRSWARPSLHSIVQGAPRPGPCARELNILIVRDSSGSMGVEQLQQANDEAMGVLRQLHIHQVWFMDVDAKAYTPRRVKLHDIPRLNVEGRGGTDFTPAFEAAKDLRPRPELLVYMTDGYGTAPDDPPRGMVVVWCVVAGGTKPADWGHLVWIEEEDNHEGR